MNKVWKWNHVLMARHLYPRFLHSGKRLACEDAAEDPRKHQRNATMATYLNAQQQ